MLHASYSPLLSLLLGVVLVAAHLGWGLRVFGSLEVRHLAPLRLAVSILAGQSIYSLLTFVLAVTQLVTHPALVIFFIAYTSIGVSLLIRQRGTLRETAELARASLRPSIAWIPVGAMALMMLLYALAPATKIDEVYYALLAPLRVWQDGALHFYNVPFPAAIVPQMTYQISHVALFALGLPDAGAVVSVLLGFTLWLILAGAVARTTSSPTLTAMACAIVGVGLYPLIWHTTAGSHALMDLATVTTFGLLYVLANDDAPKPLLFAAIAVAAQAGVAAKISMAPALLLAVAAAIWIGRGALRRAPARGLLAIALPWLLFLGPWVGWTWLQSGSPFGPAFAHAFPGHRIPAAILETIQGPHAAYATGLVSFAKTALQHHNIFLWALAGACVVRAVRVRWLLVPAGIVGIQLAAIWLTLPHDTRFLGGLQYVLAAALLLSVDSRSLARRLTQRSVVWAVTAVLVLYVAAIGWYWWPHLRVVAGLESRESYLRRYVAFYDDFVQLDRLLPADAVLVPDKQIAAVYAPRLVVSAFDLPAGRPAYTFVGIQDVARERSIANRIAGPSHLPGASVYENRDAVIDCYRTPWKQARRGHLIVREVGPAPLGP
ncbi:MAG: hypothetical protein ACSLFQ_21440 [Thermoanaerobaculia bacterium]